VLTQVPLVVVVAATIATTSNSTAANPATTDTTTTNTTTTASSVATASTTATSTVTGTCVLSDLEANDMSQTAALMRTGAVAGIVAKTAVAVFAPPDAAITAVLAMLKIPDVATAGATTKAQLQALINYHVYPSKWVAQTVFASSTEASVSLLTRLADTSALPPGLLSAGCVVRTAAHAAAKEMFGMY
jgi:hypothetical protein